MLSRPSPKKFLHIAVIDDHKLFLDGLSMVVTSLSEAYRVDRFSTPAEFVSELDAGEDFSLVICDLIMQPINGLGVLTVLNDMAPSLPTLIVSGVAMSPPIEHIQRLGGRGFVPKSADSEMLGCAIETLLSGGSYFQNSPENSPRFNGNNPSGDSNRRDEHRSSDDDLPKLSSRQIDVLRLIANGAANRDIAKSLCISENTVKSHLKILFTQLRVSKRTACVRKAQSLGLI